MGKLQKRGTNRAWLLWVGSAGLLAVVIAVAVSLALPFGADAGEVGASPGGRAGIRGDVSTLDVAGAYPGEILIVNFMAIWCQPCWAEIPEFVRVYEDYRDRGVQMVGISLQTSRDETRTMIETLGITYPVYLDSDGEAARGRFRLRGMPTTFIFKDGQQLRKLTGEVGGRELEGYVEELL